MSYDDQCATRYVAGYVCRKVHDKLKSSKMPPKNDLLLTLYEFTGSGGSEMGQGFTDPSENWIDAIDRGGLWHVTDQVYVWFCYVEEEIRRHFTITSQAGFDEMKEST